MCVSPYPHVRQHTTNPCLYWIGPYQDQALQFDLAAAQGETCTTKTLGPWSSQNMQINPHDGWEATMQQRALYRPAGILNLT